MPEVSRGDVKAILDSLAKKVDSQESPELLKGVSSELRNLRLWEGLVLRDLCEITNRINELETKIFLRRKEASLTQ
jgi:hypothetical protein